MQVIRQLGGIATLADLNDKVDTSQWGTGSPDASIRRIVQEELGRKCLSRIEPGLYCLPERYSEYGPLYDEEDEKTLYRKHTLYQSVLVDMARINKLEAYVPPRDRKQKYTVNRALGDLPIRTELPEFGYERLMKEASTVDVVWMNRREMPAAWYEVEMTTNMLRSLEKFHELQDFHADMYIVAPKDRENMLRNRLDRDIFHDIRERVRFIPTTVLMDKYQDPYGPKPGRIQP